MHNWSGGRAAEKTEGRTGHKKEEEGGQIDVFCKETKTGTFKMVEDSANDSTQNRKRKCQ